MPPRPEPRTFGELSPSEWPGERLGLPREGQNSVGRVGRRIAALAVDWGLAVAVSVVFFNYNALATTLVFFVLQVACIPTLGGSIGHRLLGLRIITLTGDRVGLWRPLVRSALLAVVIPALVWDSDQRGFHDKVAGTVLIRS